ncbi:hypothetical protein [Natronorubrum tibetense]|uniref:Uncharacterized protein n=1 Tax=Natronorubrum tibetense GA33 TaxID=1114856 RepID=L9VML4_9EURY|nr:hypothetical protein [Natronorubrum tibetense]ELY38445.1 hypothetical protein C496_17522 [Natronorubrum tibetense GA33]
MSALRSALLEWNADRVSRILVAGLAVYLAARVTDEVLVGLGAAVLFAVVLDLSWTIANRVGSES